MCKMTKISRTCDSFDFDGKTTLLGNDGNEDIFVSAIEKSKFAAEYKFIGFISLMLTNMIRIALAVEENHTYFSSDH